MFADPNGSGKSTLRNVLNDNLIGTYINADDIEREIVETGRLTLSQFNLNTDAKLLVSLLRENKRLELSHKDVHTENEQLQIAHKSKDSYLASVIAEEIRVLLLKKQSSFTFETVMSHPSKTELLAKAQQLGYRTYLYYIATEDSEINRSRVANRVKAGGHDVPANKIATRYERSLNLLLEAIRNTDRAYLFDNSGKPTDRTWFAEITDGKKLTYKSDSVPAWFNKYVLKRLS